MANNGSASGLLAPGLGAATIVGVELTLGQLEFISSFAPDPKDKEAVRDFTKCYRREFKNSLEGSPDISWEKMQQVITNILRKNNRMGVKGHGHRELLRRRKKRLQAAGLVRPCYSRTPR